MKPITTSALLVIDAQQSFTVGDRWSRRSNPHFENNVAQLIDAYRDAGLPVVFILHTDSDEAFHRDSPHFRLMDFITRRDDELLLVKNTRNSFTSTDLQLRLDALDVRRVIITGIQTEQCCETTARLAADLGYDVDFITDATMTFPITNDETGEVLPVDAIIHRTEFVLRKRFARIRTTNDLVAEVKGALAQFDA